ncbi:MAG: chemotaxis protein CheW [Desulfobulbaceae bacterium]|nr:chemotaxis protein CheW [Desulfobulbaceae bacterium]HIJ79880.1 purine-binding chemotaxis protein CheW [Deltaproteobacteria bacterium]
MDNQLTNIPETKAVGGKFLTFNLEQEEYGILINRVKEIIGMMPVSAIPRASQFIKGVINLRGIVIPIVDLRLKFGMQAKEQTEKTCIIVIEQKKGEQKTNIGIIVDSVSEVLTISPENIDPPPALVGCKDHSYLDGIAKSKNCIKMILNIDEVLAEESADYKEKIQLEPTH